MTASSFPVDEAQLVALFMEAVAYGIYLVTLGICARALFWDRLGFRHAVNWPMVAVVLAMAIFATIDVALGLRHNLDAFIFYSGPGGADGEFDNISNWVNVMKVSAVRVTVACWKTDVVDADGGHADDVDHRGWHAGT